MNPSFAPFARMFGMKSPYRKLSQQAVHYRKAEEPNIRDCHVCKHRRGSDCDVMQGQVASGMVCDYFEHGSPNHGGW